MLSWGNLAVCIQHGPYLQVSSRQHAVSTGMFRFSVGSFKLVVQVKYVGVTPALTFRNQGHKCLFTACSISAEAEEAWKSLAAQICLAFCCHLVQLFPPFFLPILSYSAHMEVVPEDLQDDGVSTTSSSTSVIEKDREGG